MKLKSPYYILLARYRAYRKYWRGAARNYRSVVAAYPRSNYWRYKLADALFRDKEYSQTLNELDRISNASRGLTVLVTLLRIRCYDRMERYDDLDKEMSLGASVIIPEVVILYAESLVRQSRWEDALGHLLTLSNTTSTDVSRAQEIKIDYLVGFIYTQLGDLEEADRSYQRALEAEPRDVGVAALHMANKNTKLAKEALEVYIRDNPRSARAHFLLGKVYSKLSRAPDAAKMFARFIELDEVSSAGNSKPQDNTIIFDAYMGRNYACSPRAIYEVMVKDSRFKDYNFIWVTRGVSFTRHWRFIVNRRTEIVQYGTEDYFRSFARAKYWVTNSRIPLVEKTHESQVYIQCWHGTPLKRLGHSIESSFSGARHNRDDLVDLYDHQTRKFDYFISPSKKATEYLDEAFRLSDFGVKILETGYPRNDFLYNFKDSDVKRVKTKLKIPKNKKVLLYAPTWRDDQHVEDRGYTYKAEVDFDKIKDELDDDWVVLFRAHYFIANSFDFQKYKDFIIDVSDYDDINDLYIVSDALMTDYSSVFFDYANLKRPILFFMYDLEHYQNNLRGFYLDLKDLPGDILKTEKEVIDTLSDLDSYTQKHKKTYTKFNKTYNYLDDGQAAKRVVERVI